MDIIILHARQGKILAQKELFKRFYGYVMSICLRYTSTKEEAEEVLNDTFIKVFDKLDTYNLALPFKQWIRQITIYKSIDYIRTQRNVLKFDEMTLDIEVSDEEIGHALSDYPEILELLQNLSPKYRTVFNLYVFEEYKHREIAILLKISEGTSKSNYARAKQILKKTLQAKTNNTSIQHVSQIKLSVSYE